MVIIIHINRGTPWAVVHVFFWTSDEIKWLKHCIKVEEHVS